MESWHRCFFLGAVFFGKIFPPSMQDCHAQVPALVVLQHSWPWRSTWGIMQCISAGRRVKVDMLAVAVPNIRGFTPAKDKHMLSFMKKGRFRVDHVEWNRYKRAGITGTGAVYLDVKTKRRSPCPSLLVSWNMSMLSRRNVRCLFARSLACAPAFMGPLLAMLKILVSWQTHKLGSNKHQVVAVSSSVLVFPGFARLLAGFCAPDASPTDCFFRFSGTCLLTGTNLRFEQHHLHILCKDVWSSVSHFAFEGCQWCKRCRLFREELIRV